MVKKRQESGPSNEFVYLSCCVEDPPMGTWIVYYTQWSLLIFDLTWADLECHESVWYIKYKLPKLVQYLKQEVIGTPASVCPAHKRKYIVASLPISDMLKQLRSKTF